MYSLTLCYLLHKQSVLPTLEFSSEFGLVFCGVAGFLKTCGLLFLLIFCFVEFSCQHMLGLFYGLTIDF